MQLLEITRERFEAVYEDIADGSEPALRFYLLVTVSTLIAGFGLLLNSTAVVIGAMLVAPLMTPIFGISLALVRGETDLFGRAIRAEIVGVTAAVVMSLLLGLLLGDFEPTAEMLSRTRPTLFDLVVAILAGFAGAYALVDEKISPALPGVAIATAIVPPLANTGLCLALGEVAGGVSSFLLFLANFLSILVVASITFVLSGMGKRFGVKAKKGDLLRRFQLPVLAFVLIAGFLGHSLWTIVNERKIAKGIEETLIRETSRIPSTRLDDVHFYNDEADNDERIHVVATISTPKILTPTQVTVLQDRLAEQIGLPTELIVHCVLSSNVSALGSVNNAIQQNLDGTFTKSGGSEMIRSIATTEQVIREYLSSDLALNLDWVDYVPRSPQRKIMLAHISGFRQPDAEEIRRLESDVRRATADPTIELAFSQLDRRISTAEGEIRYGWILGRQHSPETIERIRRMHADIVQFFDRQKAYRLVNTHVTRLDDSFHFLLEIVGPEICPRESVQALQAQLEKKFAETIALYAWSRIEVVHGPDGSLSMKELDRYFSRRQKENLPPEIPLILEASSR